MKSEQTIQSEIIIEINKRGHRLWRSNAGRVVTKDNRVIQLMPKGFPDTVGFRKTDGKFIVIEIKTAKGKLRPEQEKFKTFIETQPVIYGVARSVNDAINIIEGEGYGNFE